MNGLIWSIKDHLRFTRFDRLIVRFLLWMYKQTPCTIKDVWLCHIIPYSIHKLVIPYIYVANLPFSMSADDLKNALPVEIDDVLIYLRQGGKSKGCGIVHTVRHDDYCRLLDMKKLFTAHDPFLFFTPVCDGEIGGGESVVDRYLRKYPINGSENLKFARGSLLSNVIN